MIYLQYIGLMHVWDAVQCTRVIIPDIRAQAHRLTLPIEYESSNLAVINVLPCIYPVLGY